MHRYIIIIILLFTVNLSAQETKVISLQAAKDMALQQNQNFQGEKAALEAAKWNKTSAMSSFLPSLSLAGTLLYMDPARTIPAGGQDITMNKDQRSIALNLSQPLFMGGRLYQSYKIASASAQMASLGLEMQELQLKAEVEAKYYAVLQLKDIFEIASRELEQAAQNLAVADLKLETGILSRADHLRFQASLANKDIALLQAETAYDLALRAFMNFLGADEPLLPEAIALDKTEIQLLIDLDKEAIQGFKDRAYDLAQKNNQSLKILDKGVEISQRAQKIANAAFWPSLTLVGTRSYAEDGIDRYEFETSNQIMLNLSVPLLPQVGNYAKSRKAYYEAQQTAFNAESAKDGIDLGLEAAAINLINSARAVQNAQLSLNITEEMYAQISERFRVNMISTMELMDAELMVSASRMAHARAYYDFLKARLNLLSLMGSQDEELLSTIFTR
ncbi:MAG: TolC family protein [Candidatus Cloacimonetes bacterium]|jgi:outer membrane protein TolC|nr:TolC family protein [Candidatus Cloacimonadota bacterium]MDY0172563.1 TolC family protein [Candidatus Cloacimonadaceae bacterium]